MGCSWLIYVCVLQDGDGRRILHHSNAVDRPSGVAGATCSLVMCLRPTQIRIQHDSALESVELESTLKSTRWIFNIEFSHACHRLGANPEPESLSSRPKFPAITSLSVRCPLAARSVIHNLAIVGPLQSRSLLLITVHIGSQLNGSVKLCRSYIWMKLKA